MESIVTALIDSNIDIDLSNPSINPDSTKIEGCCIFWTYILTILINKYMKNKMTV